jgi:hypothetical protein
MTMTPTLSASRLKTMPRVNQAAEARDTVAYRQHGAHIHSARGCLEGQDLLLELRD